MAYREKKIEEMKRQKRVRGRECVRLVKRRKAGNNVAHFDEKNPGGCLRGARPQTLAASKSSSVVKNKLPRGGKKKRPSGT